MQNTSRSVYVSHAVMPSNAVTLSALRSARGQKHTHTSHSHGPATEKLCVSELQQSDVIVCDAISARKHMCEQSMKSRSYNPIMRLE